MTPDITNACNLPSRSRHYSRRQLLEITGVGEVRLIELMELGWIDPMIAGGDEPLFLARDVYRIAKLQRLVTDFEICPLSASIIVDLLERIETLEKRVEELRRLL